MANRMPLGVGMIQKWLRNYPPESFLTSLKEKGAQFVEIYLSLRHWEERVEWLTCAHRKGLFFTFHGPFNDDCDVSRFESSDDFEAKYIDLMDHAARLVRRTTGTSRINLHGAGSQTLSKEELIEKTSRFLKWLHREKERREWPFEFVVELLPFNPEKRKAGENVPELLEIARRAGDAFDGFCWDFGHYRLNELAGHEASLDAEFLKRVRHVHIHDIKDLEREIDHVPLSFGTVPYEQYLAMVDRERLYMVLELNYQHASLCGDPAEGLMDSIEKLHAVKNLSMNCHRRIL